jgi:hypothetical protein
MQQTQVLQIMFDATPTRLLILHTFYVQVLRLLHSDCKKCVFSFNAFFAY